ncbi:MAG: phospholipase, partial [Gammaproteobacteria bacterium]|nr:phospholipase [Gammaproteobacteria bacterium]
HPPLMNELGQFLEPIEARLKESSSDFLAMPFPEHLASFKHQVDQGITYILRACDGVIRPEDSMGQIMKAMRASCRAQEYVYPIANVMKPVNQYFLEPEVRQNEGLLASLTEGAGREKVGLFNAGNNRDQRGGFTLYIPENNTLTDKRPLVVVLHGGTGHGADFLWSWVREARSRNFYLLAPTSRRDTWSLMGEEHDLGGLLQMLDYVREGWSVDEEHILLTGMSDGGTYSLLAGLREDTPFTHLAPFSGVLHPEIAMSGNMAYAREKPIYLVHGTHDWMFPVETARMAAEELRQAGATIEYREVQNLSHTYARSLNPDLLCWFNPSLDIRNA